MAFSLLQASLSHFIAERDKCLAELGFLLNHSTGYLEESITDRINNMIIRLTNADAAIKTVQEIIDSNKSTKNVEDFKELVTQLQDKINPNNTDDTIENPLSNT